MTMPFPPRSLVPLLGAVALSGLSVAPAAAHVKWFAPYIVGAPPQPVSATLTNPWFWIGIILVLIFFTATRKH